MSSNSAIYCTWRVLYSLFCYKYFVGFNKNSPSVCKKKINMGKNTCKIKFC